MKTKKPIAIVIAVLAVMLAACAPQPSGGANPTPAPCDEELTTYDGWWAVGDSGFAGVGSTFPGAPVYIDGMLNRSVAGDTIVKAAGQQSTVRGRIAAIMCREGKVPTKVLIHAGGADLFVRQVWGANFPFSRYVEEIDNLNNWLSEMGVERIVWTSIIPMTANAAQVPQNSYRLNLNLWLSTMAEFVDCESVLTNEHGFLPASLAVGNNVFPYDGAHLNNAGARLHAECLVAGLGDPSLTLKE